VRPDRDGVPRVLRLPLLIRREEVLHFLGYPETYEPPQRVEVRIGSALAEARDLAAAAGTYRHLPVAAASSIGLEPIPAAGLVIGLVTVGEGIEKQVAELLRAGDATGALLLDAAGSAAAEEAADHLGAIIANEDPEDASEAPAEDVPPTASHADPAPPEREIEPASPVACRISPGYGSWPLEAQSALLDRLPHARLGVSLLPSMLMVPRKSISFAMWLGTDARPIAGASGCARCRLGHCRYRRRTT
jgi:hypothetical protein